MEHQFRIDIQNRWFKRSEMKIQVREKGEKWSEFYSEKCVIIVENFGL